MGDGPGRSRVSAGLLLYRRTSHGVEVLLAHPGGPYFAGKDDGVWSIPKGQAEPGEVLLEVAKREFGEETGHVIGSSAALIELGSIRQRGGKTVYAWALEGDLDPADSWSNSFQLEWPPRSGLFIEVPEVDRVAWFEPHRARVAMNEGQAPLVDLLLETLKGPQTDESARHGQER